MMCKRDTRFFRGGGVAFFPHARNGAVRVDVFRIAQAIGAPRCAGDGRVVRPESRRRRGSEARFADGVRTHWRDADEAVRRIALDLAVPQAERSSALFVGARAILGGCNRFSRR
jgi:hypothetical protein